MKPIIQILKNQRTSLLVALFYFFVVALIPIIFIANTFEHGMSYAKLYGHYFLYPLVFGSLALFCLASGLRNARYLFKKYDYVTIFGFSILMSSLALINEIYSENLATWEIKSSLVDRDNLLKKWPLTANKYSTAYINATGDPPHIELSKNLNIDIYSIEEIKKLYQFRLNQLAGDLRNWSALRYIYLTTFPIQVFALTALLFSILRYLIVVSRLEIAGSRENRILWCLTCSLVFSLPFLLLRVSFLQHKNNIYPSHQLPLGEILIVASFVLASTAIATVTSKWFKENIRTFTLAVTSMLSIVDYFNQEALADFFGPETNMMNYWILAGFLVSVMYLLTDFSHEPDC